LHRVFNDPVDLPVVQRVEYQQIITFEICAWSPLPRHIKRMRELINQAAEP
jgi:hypothetical protein